MESTTTAAFAPARLLVLHTALSSVSRRHAAARSRCHCRERSALRPRHTPLLLGGVRTPLDRLGICSLQTSQATGLHATMPAASRRFASAPSLLAHRENALVVNASVQRPHSIPIAHNDTIAAARTFSRHSVRGREADVLIYSDQSSTRAVSITKLLCCSSMILHCFPTSLVLMLLI